VIHDIVVADTAGKGLGVYARCDFRAGEFIFRRRYGRKVTAADLHLLAADELRHLCELDFKTTAVLLPPGCYLNHACDPSAMRRGVTVFAWRDIRAGEEITIDYRLNGFDEDCRWECRCGTAECPGIVVGSFFSMAEERQRAYLPYAPGFIRAEYRRRRRSTP
jgi:uncharacterized protein